MSRWVIKGIRTGIKTTTYPRGTESAPGTTPGLPGSGAPDSEAAQALVEICPTGVFTVAGGELVADVRGCIHCLRCVRLTHQPANWQAGSFEWAAETVPVNKLPGAFKKSVHICVVDTGDCGACLNEVRQLNNPYYNMHRLGLFITPTPRHADILLIVGPGTDHMRYALQKIYAAMPSPKRVVAAGACALSGGVFAGSFTCSEGIGETMPVDVEIPGCPPPPLAILHGLLVAAGRRPPAGSPATTAKTETPGTA